MAVSFYRAQNSNLTVCSDVENDVVRFANVCRLLSNLAVHADDIFAILLTECRQVAERTNRLTRRLQSGLVDSVMRLDARTARRPKRNLSATAKSTEDSVLNPGDFHARYGYDCRLLTRSTRPSSVCKLYAIADTSPCHAIAACDQFRGDGFSGCCIFSPCLTLQSTTNDGTDPEDITESYWESDEPSSVASIRSVSALHSLSIAARKRPARVPHLCVNESSPEVIPTLANCNETVTQVVSVDVTGSNFASHNSKRLLCIATSDALEQSCYDQVDELGDAPIGFTFAVIRRRRVRSRSKDSVDCRARKSFDSVNYDRLVTRRVEKYAPVSTTPVPVRRRPATVSQLKRRSRSDDVESSLLCPSWRHSFCAASKREDLWAESRLAAHHASCSYVSKNIEESSTVLRRSNSLPRSFGNSRSVSMRRSKSCPSKEEIVYGPTLSSKDEINLPPRLEESSDGKAKKRSHSLDRLTSRRSFRRFLPRFCSATSKYSSVIRSSSGREASIGCSEVHVEIPDRPWTKPFATVKLRPHASVDTESYQSSSGHWSMSASQSLNRDSFNPTLTSAEVHCSDTDSAVSLPIDLHNRDSGSVFTTSRHGSVISDTIDSSSGGSSFKSTRLLDDQLSVFSVDQEGFYTSMHADSGLTRAPGLRFQTVPATRQPFQSPDSRRQTNAVTSSVKLDSSALTSSLSPQMARSSSYTVSTSIDEVLRSSVLSKSRSSPPPTSRQGVETTHVTSFNGEIGTRRLYDDLVTSTSSNIASELVDWKDDWEASMSTPQPKPVTATQISSSFEAEQPSSEATLNQCQSEEVDRFSTWPCSPVLKFANEPSSGVRGILKSSAASNGSSKKVSGPRTITFSQCADSSPNGSTPSHLDFSQSPETNHKLQQPPRAPFTSRDRVQNIHYFSSTADQTEDELDWFALTKSLMTSADDVEPAAVGRRESENCSPIRDLSGVSARLVISSPISKKTAFVENAHRRLICRCVTRDQAEELSEPKHPGQKLDVQSRTLETDLLFIRSNDDGAGESVPKPIRTHTTMNPALESSGVLHASTSGTKTLIQQRRTVMSMNLSGSELTNFKSSESGTSSSLTCTEIEPSLNSLWKQSRPRKIDFKASATASEAGKPYVLRNQCMVIPPETGPTKVSSSGRCTEFGPHARFENNRNGLPVNTSDKQGEWHSKNDEITSAESRTTRAKSLFADKLNSTDVGGKQNGAKTSCQVGSRAEEDLTCSTDSISSTLSAAECYRTAELSFVAVDSSRPKREEPIAECCSSFALPLLVNRLLNTDRDISSSCSSSGMGSSASASPMDSPISNSSSRYVQDTAINEKIIVASPISTSTSERLDRHANKIPDQFDFQLRSTPEDLFVNKKFTIQTAV